MHEREINIYMQFRIMAENEILQNATEEEYAAHAAIIANGGEDIEWRNKVADLLEEKIREYKLKSN